MSATYDPQDPRNPRSDASGAAAVPRDTTDRGAGYNDATDRRNVNDPRDMTSRDMTNRDAAAVPTDSQSSLREEVVERERAEFGGMKFGSAFFGWLTAVGTAVILAGIISGISIAIAGGVEEAANQASGDVVGGVVLGAIIALVVMFVAYFCGGYVAGRMARFNGAKQGVAVWLWAIVIAIVLAIIGAIAGSQFNVLANVNAFPTIPFDPSEITVAGIITILLALAASLGGAILGGITGMRYHRRVDRVGLGR